MSYSDTKLGRYFRAEEEKEWDRKKLAKEIVRQLKANDFSRDYDTNCSTPSHFSSCSGWN